MDLPELRARRLIAQRLAPGQQCGTAVDAAHWMLATQGQLYNSGLAGLAARAAEAPNPASLSIVRTWSQRGTHHFLAAEDAQWMMRLCAPRPEVAAAKRRPSLGLTEQDVATARGAFHEALSDGPVSRTEAYALFAAAGVSPEEYRGQHLLRSFGSDGTVVQGARRGNEDVFMLVSALTVQSLELEGDAALAELGTRYFHSRGPATVQDLAWWSGLTVRDAKKAAVLARDVIEMDGYLMGAFQEDWSNFEEALALTLSLPAFDEYLLGYKDRSDVCPAELVPIVGPTRNGICRPFVVTEGIVTGLPAS
ncbi:hypothetical protein CKALI_11840 [Corynebacterium kalinowskii]|uniref:Winged helix DNA-binding domain-containing protein n=1 Tax=Corynebacterium kalinowskii TaxID=2675216 RepID=A0A6B8VWY3_9CORY|nr:crosslink repair DNA glycosylase YcaQ family protein [Corynebacterium kalinowskii]QGU03206.1 hypothetical protein CKALI_11840 [Corynebacterium kalinowskii]